MYSFKTVRSVLKMYWMLVLFLVLSDVLLFQIVLIDLGRRCRADAAHATSVSPKICTDAAHGSVTHAHIHVAAPSHIN